MTTNKPTLPRHSAAMLAALGIQGGRLPLGGLAGREINGVFVWVDPASPHPPRNGWKSSVHRVRCECPTCKAHLSAGRFFQHKCDPKRVADLARLNAEADALPPISALGPVPCPFCSKLMPPTYGEPGVSLLRADNETLICSDCGTREALEGGLKMPVSKFLEQYGSHDIYLATITARKFKTYTGELAPWVPRSAASIRAEIRARGLGGSYEGNEPGVAGFEMSAACAWEFARFHSLKHGRGSSHRECIEALRGNGR